MNSIIFPAQLIPKVLNGSKTQARRIIKPQPPDKINSFYFEPTEKYPEGIWRYQIAEKIGDGITFNRSHDWGKCPYKIGQRVWVRETWCPQTNVFGEEFLWLQPFYFASPGNSLPIGHRWRPSIHMPKWASRMDIIIEDIGVEQIQNISEEAAKAEGCDLERYRDYVGRENLWPCPQCNGFQVHGALGANLGVTEVDCCECDTSKKMFKHLWNSLHESPKPTKHNPYTWQKEDCYISYPWEGIREEREYRSKVWYVVGNPHVWVYRFKAEVKT